jgi:hypothetical protein
MEYIPAPEQEERMYEVYENLKPYMPKEDEDQAKEVYSTESGERNE